MDPIHNAPPPRPPPPSLPPGQHLKPWQAGRQRLRLRGPSIAARLTSGLKRYKLPDVILRSGQFNSRKCAWESGLDALREYSLWVHEGIEKGEIACHGKKKNLLLFFFCGTKSTLYLRQRKRMGTVESGMEITGWSNLSTWCLLLLSCLRIFWVVAPKRDLLVTHGDGDAAVLEELLEWLMVKDRE